MGNYTLKEACKLLGISQQTLRRWEKTGKIKCVRTEGGHRRFPVEEIARILGCPVEELENIKVQRPEENGLREKKREVKALRLMVEKEKISKVLEGLRGDEIDKAVKEAKGIVEIERAKKELEALRADKTQKETEKITGEKRKQWLDAWITYGFEYFGWPLWDTTFPTPATEIPLEWQIKIKRAVIEALKDTAVAESIEEVKFIVNEAVDTVREDYSKKHIYPQLKTEFIASAIGGLIFPFDIDTGTEKVMKDKIREYLEAQFTGSEEPEKIYKTAEELKDKMLDAYRDKKASLRRFDQVCE